MILADLEHGTPGMVIDPHGLLVQRVMELATPEQADRIILLEADADAPFGLNLLAIRKTTAGDDPVSWTADIVVSTIKKLYGQADEYLPRLEHYLDLAVRTLIPNDGTLAQVPRLFRNDEFRRQCLKRVTDIDILDDWAQYEALRKTEQMTHIEVVVNRLSRMLRAAVLQGILGSHETTVPFEQILNGDSMLLVSLPSEKLSPERCDFIGSMLLSALADRIFTRNLAGGPQPRLHIYLDEYQRFATSTTVELLAQGRKYEAGVTMAHQTLIDITDQRIRNAARLAGTLIVMDVTRPDAEELAGEFPITPDPEWVETIGEIDGTEPVFVQSPTPAEDIYLNPHNDPDVDLAARSFFAYTRPFNFNGEPDKRRTVGVYPRPGGLQVDDRVKLYPEQVQPFLIRAMAGELSTNELFADALIESSAKIWVTHDYTIPRAVFFQLVNDSPAIKRPSHDSWCGEGKPLASKFRSGGRTTGTCDCHIYEYEQEVRPHNEEVERIFKTSVFEQLERIRTWLLPYLEDRDALRAGETTEGLKNADRTLLEASWSCYWDGLWKWTSPLHRTSAGVLERIFKFPFILPPLDPTTGLPTRGPRRSDLLCHPRWKRTDEALDILRQRLRWLVILADGLQRSPILVPSGEQQPHRTTRHIVHGGQTHADALNELAGKLVHPPQRYVAHVRQPQEYHQAKLRPPLGGEEDGTRRPNPDQPDDIRTRSRALYDTSGHDAAVIPLEQPLPRRRATRRPQEDDVEEES